MYDRNTKQRKACARDLRFGDLVELSRWTGEVWHRYPLTYLAGCYGVTSDARICDTYSQLSLPVDPGDQFCVMSPDQVVYKICSGDLFFKGEDSVSFGVFPIGNRVILEEIPEKGHDVLTIIEYQKQMTRFRVVSCGQDVEDVMPGDVVYIAREAAGSVIEREAENWFSVRESDIAMLEVNHE